MIESFVKTHIGQRDLNEDRYLIDEELGLYIVADGVGGLDKGEVASKLTCQLIQQNVKNGLNLVESIEAAHQFILTEISNNTHNKGMASTVVVVRFDQANYEIAWVGDSRVYLWDGELKLLTRDHSYLELLFVGGHISIDEFKDHPNKNVISQALGIERKTISVSLNKGTLTKNQILLMSSDGLYEVANEKIVIDQMLLNESIEKLTNVLVDCAVDLDGKDNITLLTLQNTSDTDPNNAINAEVVRIYNSETGRATELKEDIINQERNKQPVISKSIKPKSLAEPENSQSNSKMFNRPIEMVLLILIVIGILVILNLNF